jgi:short-subunit dehydrogenase
MNYILILGAKSDIARALACQYAGKGYNLYLAGRDINTLQEFSRDLEIRHNIKTSLYEFDVEAVESHHNFYSSLPEKPYGVIFAAGYMTEQKNAENNYQETLRTITVNYSGAISILNIIAGDFESRGNGFIIGISSVAGDRGRRKNYIYGSTKAAFSAYLSGLRNRLSQSNVQVLTVKPGFVRTRMTAGMKLPALLTANPEKAAKDIFTAQQKGRNIVYTLWLWRYIMLIIRLIPEGIFKRLNL